MILPIRPEEAAKIVLRRLPTKRMRDILEKRYGLRGGRKKTLDAIGKEYKITRERVRQIETDALRHLANAPEDPELRPFYDSLRGHIERYGRVMSERYAFSTLGYPKLNPHLAFLFSVGRFTPHPETDLLHRRWGLDLKAAEIKEGVLKEVVADLEKQNIPVSEGDLLGLISRHFQNQTGEACPPQAALSYLASSKLVVKNPYGEYGLATWPSVRPRGVRDKAFLTLLKSGKPMHFREVAEVIDKTGWNKKKAHPQTVHNELIKDSRFVLVGRGIYALREWGYESGTVSEIVSAVLKRVGKPLTKDEIVKLVLEKRMVKAPTVFLNLQDKSLFRRTKEGKYTLA